MIYKTLVREIATDAEVTQKVAARILDSFKEIIIDELENGEEVRLHEFGKFEVRRRAAKQGRDPRNGNVINIPERNVVKFTAFKNFKSNIQ